MTTLWPVLFVIAVWWLGTGLVLFTQQRIAWARLSLITALLGLSLLSLSVMLFASTGTEAWQSYAGFVAAVCLWGCIELSYYTGLIGGVHQRSCPVGCTTGRRFRLALGASIWHEVSVLFCGGLVVSLLIGADNTTGLHTFLVLWLMRWSAKLNLFFGVPNFNTDWFPKRLAYAHSYIRRGPITVFFPFSLLLALLIAAHLLSGALTLPYDEALMRILPGVLLMLAILEHVFMALPIADSELWNRIFARDEVTRDAVMDTSLGDHPALEALSAQRIRMRSEERVFEALSVSTNGVVSVKLDTTDTSLTRSTR